MLFEGVERPVLGDIALLARLGAGGMALVYYGVNRGLAQERAVKVLPPPRLEQEGVARERFVREARLAAEVESPNLVKVFSLGEDRGSRCHYIEMEYVNGWAADRLVRSEARSPWEIPEGAALDVCIAATRGLLAAHQKGIIHRDIKPANILVPEDAEGRLCCDAAKLADLGLAKRESGGDLLTAPESVFGTPGFMSPEQIRHVGAATKLADVFAMGATLYALLTGRPPFEGSIGVACLGTLTGMYDPVRRRRSSVSEASQDLIDTCLQPESEDRFADASQLLDALIATREGLGADSYPHGLVVPVTARRQSEQAVLFPRGPSAGAVEGFRRAVEDAKQKRDYGLLGLLAEEVGEIACQRMVARALFQLEAWQGARRVLESVRLECAGDADVEFMFGTACERLGDIEASNRALQSALDEGDLRPSEKAEAQALLGRNTKSEWVDGWRSADSERFRPRALACPRLLEAAHRYRSAFLEDQNHYYSGLNALGAFALVAELARAMPGTWEECCDHSRADDVLRLVENKVASLSGAVMHSLAAARHRLQEGVIDPWLLLSEAEYELIVSEESGSVAALYEEAVSRIAEIGSSHIVGSAKRQLEIYLDLGVFKRNARAAAAVLSSIESPNIVPTRAIVFTGHRIDADDRPSPRFPQRAEKAAGVAILQAVSAEVRKRGRRGPTVGLAGGASGGDVLFHEACATLGIGTTIMLPDSSPLARGKSAPEQRWDARLRSLTTSCSVKVLSDDGETPPWVTDPDYSTWQRANLWLLHSALFCPGTETTLIALWDGEQGDGPGGTAHMVDEARRVGAEVIVLDTKKIFRAYLS